MGLQGVAGEIPGAELRAAAALDTGGLGPAQDYLQGGLLLLHQGDVLGHHNQAGGGLGYHLGLGLLLGVLFAHEWAPDHHHIVRKVHPCLLQAKGDGGPHRGVDDNRLPDLPGDGDVLVDQGFALGGLVDGIHGAHVGHHRPHIQGDA